MKTVEPTLKERASYMYRLLVLLQQLFQVSRQVEDVEWLATGANSRDLALCTGIKELLDDLSKHAQVLTAAPFPISDWRPGDGPDDARWRGLTEIEVREVLAMLANYENLVSWGEKFTGSAVAVFPPRPGLPGSHEATDLLKGHRAQIERFRRELGFLEKQRVAR